MMRQLTEDERWRGVVACSAGQSHDMMPCATLTRSSRAETLER